VVIGDLARGVRLAERLLLGALEHLPVPQVVDVALGRQPQPGGDQPGAALAGDLVHHLDLACDPGRSFRLADLLCRAGHHLGGVRGNVLGAGGRQVADTSGTQTGLLPLLGMSGLRGVAERLADLFLLVPDAPDGQGGQGARGQPQPAVLHPLGTYRPFPGGLGGRDMLISQRRVDLVRPSPRATPHRPDAVLHRLVVMLRMQHPGPTLHMITAIGGSGAGSAGGEERRILATPLLVVGLGDAVVVNTERGNRHGVLAFPMEPVGAPGRAPEGADDLPAGVPAGLRALLTSGLMNSRARSTGVTLSDRLALRATLVA